MNCPACGAENPAEQKFCNEVIEEETRSCLLRGDPALRDDA